MVGVFFALLLSCVIIVAGVYKYNPDKRIIDTTITKELKDKPSNDTVCCMQVHKAESTPTVITETKYYNTNGILLYASILVFIILSLWGTFTVLLKVLKSENEISSKILDVQKDIYKETQMWELTKQKKEYEFYEKIALYKPCNGLEKSYKETELDFKIIEFEKIEKEKLQLKKDNKN